MGLSALFFLFILLLRAVLTPHDKQRLVRSVYAVGAFVNKVKPIRVSL